MVTRFAIEMPPLHGLVVKEGMVYYSMDRQKRTGGEVGSLASAALDSYDKIVYDREEKKPDAREGPMTRKFIYTAPFRRCWKAMGLNDEQLPPLEAALAAGAEDLSPKTWKNLRYEAESAGVPAVRLLAGMEELGRACGKKAGVFAVTDEGFAKAILGMTDVVKREKEEHAL